MINKYTTQGQISPDFRKKVLFKLESSKQMQLPENMEFGDILSDGIAVYFQVLSVFLSLPLRSIRRCKLLVRVRNTSLRPLRWSFLY
ncbi:MAG TPA: hypothetical protein GXZ55_03110 [Natronincola sp.]|nr:hypothetical protein [Natronincola sp.]